MLIQALDNLMVHKCANVHMTSIAVDADTVIMILLHRVRKSLYSRRLNPYIERVHDLRQSVDALLLSLRNIQTWIINFLIQYE